MQISRVSVKIVGGHEMFIQLRLGAMVLLAGLSFSF